MDTTTLLNEIEEALRKAFADRLKGTILYGSVARGDDTPDSDIDVLVLLEGPIKLGPDLETCVHAVFPLSLKWERPISAKPTDEQDYEKAEYPLYRSAKIDGIRK